MGIKFEPPPGFVPPDNDNYDDGPTRTSQLLAYAMVLASCALIFGLAFLCFAWGWRILNG